KPIVEKSPLRNARAQRTIRGSMLPNDGQATLASESQMFSRIPILLVLASFAIEPLAAVSVLSHEQVVDVTWQSDILPQLQSRYPDATPDQLKRAHSFAYGGSVIQDLGYYPLGNKFFTDLLHYVRTGDFIQFLIGGTQPLLSRHPGSHLGKSRGATSVPKISPQVR